MTSSYLTLLQTWYGLTAVDAYQAYDDPTSLQAAETLWNWANQYVIQPADAAQNKHPVKTVPIASTCGGGMYLGRHPTHKLTPTAH